MAQLEIRYIISILEGFGALIYRTWAMRPAWVRMGTHSQWQDPELGSGQCRRSVSRMINK